MTSWHEPSRERNGWAGFLALACGLPVLFFGLYFALDFLLQWVAGWFV